MTNRDQRTLEVVEQVSRTADRLARRMGGHYVLNSEWRDARSEQRTAQSLAQTRVPA